MITPIQDTQQFQDIISSEEPVVIKFFADWCPDCQRLNLFINEVLDQFGGIDIYEINKDVFPQLTEKYDVMGIPSLLVFKKNEKLAHLHSANAKTPEQVTTFLKDHFPS